MVRDYCANAERSIESDCHKRPPDGEIAVFDLACPDLHSASDVVIDRGRAFGLVICSLIGTCLTETGMSSRCSS